MTLLHFNGSFIYYELCMHCVKDYYDYIIYLLEDILKKNTLHVNIIIGNFKYDFNNYNKVIKISINYEHTLVKEGGRGVPLNCPKGKVLTKKGDLYLVRIDRYNELCNADIIIEYSIPNIYNVFTLGNNDFFKKMVYISPSLYKYKYELNNFNQIRNIDLLTTFINENEPRRKTLLENIKNKNLNHKNINNCFDKKSLQELYLNAKILVNIHQTNEHHTFEELRCLPALLSGVIVISEESPLNDLIPYNDLIIWCSYDKILDVVNNVVTNYDFYFNKIFKNKQLLEKTHEKNNCKLLNKLIKHCS